jgi:hypothetical protein
MGGGPGGAPTGERPPGASTDGGPPTGGMGTTANGELSDLLTTTDST